jgi:hypothetical protein
MAASSLAVQVKRRVHWAVPADGGRHFAKLERIVPTACAFKVNHEGVGKIRKRT